ncbi:MAG: hypothetical protein GXY58_08245 [Planctomycetaceae bacterium]|nr:hypothetical protein [Planctomycetaceae bacterium]
MLLTNSTALSVENLRRALFGSNVLHITPSGDTTGVTDTANIQNALNSLTAPQLSVSAYHAGPIGVVRLQGHYYVNAPLVSGIPEQPRAYGPSIISLGAALIEAVGNNWLATDYVLACYGNTVGDRGGFSRAVVSGIKIKASHKCRGLLLARQFHFSGIEKVQIEQTRQSALDMPTCWKSFARDIHILNCRGFALRLGTCDNIRLENVRIGYARGIWHANNDSDPYPLGSDAADSRNMTLYEVKYGVGAARAHYSTNYKEDWPDAADTTHPFYNEATGDVGYLQTPERERCCIWVGSPHVRASGLMLENCYYGDRPLIFIPKADNLNHLFEDMYTEVCYNTDCKVYAELSAENSTICGNLTFSNVQSNDNLTAYDATAKCRHWLRLGSGYGADGSTASSVAANVLINGIQAYGLSTGIVACSGPGIYNNIKVNNAITGTDRLSPTQWVVAETGAIVNANSTVYGVANNVVAAYKSRGTALIPGGSTSVTIAHGLSVVPKTSDIVLTATNISNSKLLAITAVSATTFTVTADTDPGSNGQSFAWQIKCNPVDYVVATTAPGECVTNGTFDSNIANWINHSTLPYDTAEWTNEGVHLVANGDGSPVVCHFYQDLGLKLGQKYRVSGRVIGSGVSVNIKKTSNQGAAHAITPASPVSSTIGSDGRFSKIVTVTNATQSLVVLATNNAAIEAWVDELSIVPNTTSSLPDSVPP